MNITLVYFVYGLAFFSMGLAMTFEARRSPVLVEGKILRPLAIFGLVHGSHEWLEMFVSQSGWLAIQNPIVMGWVRIGVLTLSFTALLVFAWRSLNPDKIYSWRYWLPWGSLTGLYTLSVLGLGYLTGRAHADYLTHIDAFVRLFVAVPAAILAGLAFYFQVLKSAKQKQIELGQPLKWAALGFILYGLTQMVVPGQDFFPASVVNSANFLLWTGVPIQFIRAILAVVITISLVYASQVVEQERQAQFIQVQQARVDAVEQLRLELVEREVMRQDLMRHIVLAQEEERTRIARELHDETSQILTGFSLHLAVLGDQLPKGEKALEQVNQLQTLSKQISESLYRLVHDLRPAQLDDLGLAAALHFLVDDFQTRYHLKTRLQVQGQPRRLDNLVETVIFRTAQEALMNVVRHAKTQEADIVLKFSNKKIALYVSDRGVGFEHKDRKTPPKGWGLAGMHERAVSVGGELIIQSSPGQGTLIQVIIPAAPITAGY